LQGAVRVLTLVEISHGSENIIDRECPFRARRFAQGRLVAHGGPIRCPGSKDGTLHLGLQARVMRDIEGVKKT
jgi:hypothetical protein